MGQVITFYSYKGGTGRSMALANTACLLAKSVPAGDSVLAIDWDLEAPGLHRFFRAEGDTAQFAPDQPGVIDLVLQLQLLFDGKESLRKDADAVADLISAVDLGRFIVPTQVPNVSLMTAGAFDQDYENRVVGFNWPAFYEKAPAALPALMEFLTAKYRYVLIDSRTGLSDLTGVCTMMLPEKLVTVFTPSRQSLDGLDGVIRRALAYRRQAPDLRPLAVFPLPSRIELAEPDLREAWRIGGAEGFVGYQPLFESLFRELYELPACSLQNYFDDVQIQHVPRYAYGERIAVLIEREPDRLSLTRSYEAFVSRLGQLTVPWDTSVSHAPLAVPSPSEDEAERSYRQAAELFADVGDNSGQARTLAKLAGHQLRRGLKDEANRTLEKTIDLARNLDEETRAGLFLELGDLVVPADPTRAITMYDGALVSSSDLTRANAFRRRGDAYFLLAQFRQSLDDYNSALLHFKRNGEDRMYELQPRLAKANLEAGRFATAAEQFSDIVRRAPESGDKLGEADALVNLALAALGKGDTYSAFENVVRARQAYVSLGRSNPDVWLVYARIAASRGDLDEADKLINLAVQEFRELGDKRGIATALRYAGDFRASRKQAKIS